MFLFKGTALVRVLLKAEEAGKDTTTHIHTHTEEIYYTKLTHAIMEA